MLPFIKNVNRAKDFRFDQAADKRVIHVQNGFNVYYQKCLAGFVARPIDPNGVVVVLDGIVTDRVMRRPIFELATGHGWSPALSFGNERHGCNAACHRTQVRLAKWTG